MDPGGGGALRYRGRTHPRYVFRGRRGPSLRPPHVCDFVKEGYFFVHRYEVWWSKSPYNPRNIRGSDSEVTELPSLLPPLAAAKHAEDYKKYVFPFIQCQCFDKRKCVYLVEKISVLLK